MKDVTQNTGSGGNVRLQDIAERCGVALSTVSFALRGHEKVTAQTTELVRQVAREMGYDASRNSAARRLASSKHSNPVLSHIIGFFFAHQEDFSISNYFHRVAQGVLYASAQSEFEILTSAWSPAHVDPPVVRIAHPYKGGEVDGAVALEQDRNLRSFLQALRNEPNFGNRPVVGLVDHCDGTSGVYPDHLRSGYLVMSHLLDLGHRKILSNRHGVVGGPNHADQRWTGYDKACTERGIGLADVLTNIQWHSPVPEETEFLLSAIEREGYTAVIAPSDYDAVILHNELKSKGFRLPGDISIISYDDTDPIPGASGENILTTLRLPLGEIGFEGTNFAIKRILGQEKEDRDIILPVELIVRGSTAHPRPGA